MQNQFINEKPLGYQQLTGIGTSTPVSLAPPKGAKLLLVQAEAQGVRWRDDGSAPTSTVGYPLAAGNELRYTGTMAGMQAIQFIGQAAGAILNVTYFAQGEF